MFYLREFYLTTHTYHILPLLLSPIMSLERKIIIFTFYHIISLPFYTFERKFKFFKALNKILNFEAQPWQKKIVLFLNCHGCKESLHPSIQPDRLLWSYLKIEKPLSSVFRSTSGITAYARARSYSV